MDVFIIDSFPIPICDVKRAKASTSDLQWADGSGCLATYGHWATFFGFRGHLITTAAGVSVDFVIAAANIDDREVLPLLAERGCYRILLGDKGYISESLQEEILETDRRNQKHQYPEAFRRLYTQLRRQVKTMIGQLTDQFSVSRVRGRTHWDVRTRMSNKFGACLLGCFLNHALGRALNVGETTFNVIMESRRNCVRIIHPPWRLGVASLFLSNERLI